VRRDGTIVVLLKAPTIAPSNDPFEQWERHHEQTKAARRRQRD
jgi:hypothetical protein